MAFKIREFKASDLDNLPDAIGLDRNNTEFTWVLLDPEDPSRYNAYVVTDEDQKVFGVIGYAISSYSYNGKNITGVIPMSWRVHPKYKGFAGVQLFKKVMELGDFKFTIGGSKDAKELYSVFKLDYRYHISEYYKMLKPLRYLLTSPKAVIKNLGFIAFTFKSFLAGNRKINKDISNLEITPYVAGESISFRNEFEQEVLTKQISKNYIHWLLSCPMVKSTGFLIRYKNKPLGVAVCYIDSVNRVNRGRIVHIPYLGTETKLWSEILSFLLNHLRSNKCCYISVLANNSKCKDALKKFYFTDVKRKARPLFIKDIDGKLKDLPITDWNIQFTEGDKAYRNI